MSISTDKAIILKNALKMGFGTFAHKNFKLLSVKTAVHDGDTVKVRLSGNFSVRFLGIDTPEMTLQYPKIGSADDGDWLSVDKFESYLQDPFSDNYKDSQDFKDSLGLGLVEYLDTVLVADCAKIHRQFAEEAQRVLENMIIAEYSERAEKGKHFDFFMAFANEILDGYGRLLCYLYRNNTKTEREANPLSYNERILKQGWGFPYFIWPNVVPFFAAGKSISDSMPPADELEDFMTSSQAKKLNDARDHVRKARSDGLGVFSHKMLLPCELRYLSRRKAPSRYVLNLETCEKKLVEPTEYYTIPNSEDRLFIDSHYVDLFLKKGYEL